MPRTAQQPFAAAAALSTVPSIPRIAPPAPHPVSSAALWWRAGLEPLTAPLPHLERPAARRLCRGLMLTLGQLVAVEHRERLAAVREPAIFALNHRNRIEALLAPTVLIYLRHGAPLHFLADWMFVEAPGLGWLLRQSEPVAVYRKPALCKWRDAYRRERLRQRRPVLDACLDYLARGESIGIFPEGTRNRDGNRLLRGRLGLGELALRSGVPVVPVGIKYPHHDAWRAPGGVVGRAPSGALGPAPKGALVVLAIGEPLDFAAERRRLAAAPEMRRELARRVVDRVMAALAAEVGKDYAPGGRHHHGGHRGPAPRRPAAPAPTRGSEAT